MGRPKLSTSETYCRICEKQFSTSNELYKHNKRKHNPDLEVLACDECGKTFNTKQDLGKHQNEVHLVEADLYCNLCGLQCMNIFKLRRHTRRCLTLDWDYVANKRRLNEMRNGCRMQEFTVSMALLPEVMEKNKDLLQTYKARHENEPQKKVKKIKQLKREMLDDSMEEVENKQEIISENEMLELAETCEESKAVIEQGEREIGEKSEVEKFDLPETEKMEVKEEEGKSIKEEVEDEEEEERFEYEMDFSYADSDNQVSDGEEEGSFEDVGKQESYIKEEEDFTETFIEKPTRQKYEGQKIGKKRECTICGKFVSNMSVHVNGVHAKEKLPCPLCGLSFGGNYNLKNHIKRTHGQHEELPCPQCGKMFRGKNRLTIHIHSVHSEGAERRREERKAKGIKPKVKRKSLITCDLCGETVASLKRHLESAHNDTKHVCPECGLELKTPRCLLRHVQYVHMEKRNPQDVPCEDCGQTFPSERRLYLHRRTHHSQPVHCDECGQEYGSKQLLAYHKKSAHAPLDIRPCPECGKIFNTKPQMYNHIRHVHTPASCQQCGLVFSTTRKLDYHKSTVHTRPKDKNTQKKIKNERNSVDHSEQIVKEPFPYPYPLGFHPWTGAPPIPGD